PKRLAPDPRRVEARRQLARCALDLALVVEGQVQPPTQVLERRAAVRLEAQQRLAVTDLTDPVRLPVALHPSFEERSDLAEAARELVFEAMKEVGVLRAGDQLSERLAAILGQ